MAGLPQYDLPRWAYDRIAGELFPRANYVCLSLMTEPFMTRDFPERRPELRLQREAGRMPCQQDGPLPDRGAGRSPHQRGSSMSSGRTQRSKSSALT